MLTLMLATALAADLSVDIETDDGAVKETVAVADVTAKTEKRWDAPDVKKTKVAYTVTLHPAEWDENNQVFTFEVDGCREWTKGKKSGSSCVNWTLNARQGGDPEDGFHATEKADDGTKWGITFLAKFEGDPPGAEPEEEPAVEAEGEEPAEDAPAE